MVIGRTSKHMRKNNQAAYESGVMHLILPCIIYFAGSAYGTMENPRFTFTSQVKLTAGVNKLSLLSVSAGLAVSDNIDS